MHYAFSYTSFFSFYFVKSSLFTNLSDNSHIPIFFPINIFSLNNRLLYNCVQCYPFPLFEPDLIKICELCVWLRQGKRRAERSIFREVKKRGRIRITRRGCNKSVVGCSFEQLLETLGVYTRVSPRCVVNVEIRGQFRRN